MTCEELASFEDGWMDGWMDVHSFQTDPFRIKTQLKATAKCQICQ